MRPAAGADGAVEPRGIIGPHDHFAAIAARDGIGPDGRPNPQPKGTLEVATISLDSFVGAQQLGAVDILKFDIQGGELMALQGATGLLRSGKTALIYTEVFFVPHYEGAPVFHDISALLAGFGYSLFDLYDLHRAGNGQIRYADALFVSSAIRQGVIDPLATQARP